MDKKYLSEELINKYKNDTCTDEERAIVESWHIKDLAENTYAPSPEKIASVNARMRNSILNHAYSSSRQSVRLWLRIAAAASIILALTAGLYFYLSPDPTPQYVHHNTQNDIIPGGNKATLTLGDGRKISLTDADNGKLIEQSGIKITKAADGQLVYTILKSDNAPESLSYNTIETPVGGQYQINLPDGSKVWLNAASSLRYPVRFTGNERKVELIGEGYFEIVHDKTKPFIVSSSGQIVEVLGTHFNINSYVDEPTSKTTLLEGSVKVTNLESQISNLLKPGQQAMLNGQNLAVANIDIDQAVAWKNGDFVFDGATLRVIMRQISRWYDVEVNYQGNISEVKFGGSISRSKNINEVLKVLEMTQSVHFKIEGRRILVMQ